MRLPVIKSLTNFIKEYDEDYVTEALEVLDHLSQEPSLKDEELDVIGELISNMAGSIEVAKMVREGKDQKTALNEFMKRVMGSIDK